MNNAISQVNNYIVTSQIWNNLDAPGNTEQFGSWDGFALGVIRVINVAINVSGLVAVGILVYSGIMMIVANGEPDKVDKATNGITGSIIGLIIIVIARLVIQFVLQAAERAS